MIKHRELVDHNLIYRSRLAITFLIGLIQCAMAILSMFDRLTEVTGSEHVLFYIMTNDKYWGGAFTISALLVFIGFRQYRLHSISMSLSSGLLLTWGILTIGDVVTDSLYNHPLVGGVLALAVGIVAFFMSQIWNVVLWDIRYNNYTLAKAGAQVAWKE